MRSLDFKSKWLFLTLCSYIGEIDPFLYFKDITFQTSMYYSQKMPYRQSLSSKDKVLIKLPSEH